MQYLDKNWRLVEDRIDGSAFVNKSLGLFVIRSISDELDGANWIHVSVSRASRVPSYDDLKLVKKLFIGDDKHAYQCFVPSAEHINIHDYVLHLWARNDGKPVLPDFSRGTGSI
jgi:hypothetical protein